MPLISASLLRDGRDIVFAPVGRNSYPPRRAPLSPSPPPFCHATVSSASPRDNLDSSIGRILNVSARFRRRRRRRLLGRVY